MEVVLAIPTMDDKGFESKLSEHFGRSPFFALIKVRRKKVEEYKFMENPYVKREIRSGLTAAHWLIKKGVDIVIVKNIGEISFHALRDHGVDVYVTKKSLVREVIDAYLANKLKLLKKPTKRIGEELVEEKVKNS